MTATRRSQDKNKDSSKSTEEAAAESSEATAAEATAETIADETQEDTTATENQDEDVEMKEEKTEDDDKQEENNEKKKEGTVEIKEDDETKKNRLVDQLYKAEFLKAVTETITIEPVKSQLLKNEEFIGLLSKAKVLNLQMEHQTGTAKLTFAPYREWMASRILKGLNRLQKDDSKLNIDCSEGLKDLLALEKAGKLKGDSREQQTSKCLYVNNIPKDTTEETMKAFFPKCVKVFVRGESEESDLGWAVMEFTNKAEMEESFESQKEIEMGESKIPVCKVKPFEKRGKGFKGKGKFQKGGFKGLGDKSKSPAANKPKLMATGGDKPKGAQQSSTAMKANDLKRKAQNQKIQQFSTNQKRRKLGSMGGPMGGGMGGMGPFQFGNRNKNMRGSGMGMSILGNPRGGNSMMNLGLGPSVPNMMGMGNNMGNMMGMGNMGGMGGMGGGMGGNMGGMGMGQNMGMMGNNMGGNMSSFNNMGGNMGNQKNKRNNKRGGNMDRGGQWSGGQGNFQDSPSDELSSKLSNVLSKQRMGQDSDSDMVSMLQSALKAAQKRMSSKDSGDRDSGRMLPPNAFSNSGSSGMNQGNKKQRQQRQKKQNSGSNRWGSGSGSSGNYSSSSSSNTNYISTTGGNYGSRDNSSNWNSGSNYDSSQSYAGGSSSSSYYGGGGYSGTSEQSNTGAAYYDQGNYGSTNSSYSDTSSYKPSTQSYDFSQRSSSDSYYRSGYY